jgi:hypothetical protein
MIQEALDSLPDTDSFFAKTKTESTKNGKTEESTLPTSKPQLGCSPADLAFCQISDEDFKQ